MKSEKVGNRESEKGVAICRTYSKRAADAMIKALTDMKLEPTVDRCAFGYTVSLPGIPPDGEAIALHVSQHGRTNDLCGFCLPFADRVIHDAVCSRFLAMARAQQRELSTQHSALSTTMEAVA